MKFLVVGSIVPQILVAVLVHLVSDTVVNLFGLEWCKLLFQFVFKITGLPYAAIMIKTWRLVCMCRTLCNKYNGILLTRWTFECLLQAVNWRHEMVSDIWIFWLVVVCTIYFVIYVFGFFALTHIQMTRIDGIDWGWLQFRFWRIWKSGSFCRYRIVSSFWSFLLV